MTLIKFKRGQKINLPKLNPGEPAFTTDEKEIYIGSDDGNIKISNRAEVESLNSKAHTHNNKSVIDTITSTLINKWNSAVTHISDAIKHITSEERTLWNTVSNKVDKVSGKGLSTNDFTAAYKSKVDGIATNATNVQKSTTNGNIKINNVETAIYTHPTGTNPHRTTKSDVGLGNVTNDSQVKRSEMGVASGVATLDSNGVNAQAPKAHTHNSLMYNDLSSQTISLNTLTLSSGSPKVAYYCCPSDGSGSNITGRPDDNSKTAFNLRVELIRYISSTDYISKQTYIRGTERIMYVRYCSSGTWSAWEKIYTSAAKPTASEIGAAASNHTHNYAGSSSAGGAATSALRCTGNSATATKLATARTISLTGSVTGSGTFDGSGNLSIATTTNHTHSYLPLSGGALTGNISYTLYGSTQVPIEVYGGDANGQGVLIGAGGATIISSGEGKNQIKSNIAATTETMAIGSDQTIEFYTALQNGWSSRKSMSMGTDGKLTNSNGFVGNLSGNSSTATKLATARTINGTSFNGSANITTANWGTARTITIGNTGKSVNGSANVAWSLSEIGAAASSHGHSNINTKGVNTINSITNDTTANWGAQGHSIHWYTTAGYLNNQPSQYGYILNLGSGTEVHQIWMTQASGNMAHRGGNGSGWSGTWRTILDSSNYSSYAASASHTHNYAGSSSAGGAATSALTCTGNSATATKLATARTINGTSFNGSANITTAKWGTARTITIGNAAKSVNGSANVAWSLSEIGAMKAGPITWNDLKGV